MWIMLNKKIPVEISPPPMSIHWAGANAANVEQMRKQMIRSAPGNKIWDMGKQAFKLYSQSPLDDDGDKYWDEIRHGYEPKEDGSVWIIFDNTPIKIWPHEYTVITEENMGIYLNGDAVDYSMSHFPMYGRTALFANPITLEAIDRFDEYPRFDRTLYEAAMIDGQNELQAFYTAIGTYPLDLWFGVGSHYACYYGHSERDLIPTYNDNEIYESIKSGWSE